MSCDRILWYRTRGQKLYLSANTHRRLRKNQALLKGKSSVSQSLSGLLLAIQSHERRHPRISYDLKDFDYVQTSQLNRAHVILRACELTCLDIIEILQVVGNSWMPST